MLNLSGFLPSIHQVSTHRVKSRWREDSGQMMIEYVMIIVLVALAAFLLAPNIKSGIIKVFSSTSSALS